MFSKNQEGFFRSEPIATAAMARTITMPAGEPGARIQITRAAASKIPTIVVFGIEARISEDWRLVRFVGVGFPVIGPRVSLVTKAP
jgi:hypothetical protein